MNNCRTLDKMAASDLGERHEEGAAFPQFLDELAQEMEILQVSNLREAYVHFLDLDAGSGG